MSMRQRRSVLEKEREFHKALYRTQSYNDLFDAIGDGNENLVVAILQRSNNPVALLQKKDLQGLTPLRKAVALNKAEIARILVMAGADAGQKGALGKVALHDAALTGQRLLIAPLLASPNVSVNSPDKSGVTPLHNAVRRRHVKTVEWLLFAGADVNCQDDHEESPLSMVSADSENEIDRQIYQLLLAAPEKKESLDASICCGYAGKKDICNLGSDGLLMLATSDMWPEDPQFVFCIKITPDSAEPRFPLRHEERSYYYAYKYRLMYQLPPDKRRVKVYFTVMEEFAFSELILKVSSKSQYLGDVPMTITTYPYHRYINFLASCEMDLQNEGQFLLVKRPAKTDIVFDFDGVFEDQNIPLLNLVASPDMFPPPPAGWNENRRQRAWDEHEKLIAALPQKVTPTVIVAGTSEEPSSNENNNANLGSQGAAKSPYFEEPEQEEEDEAEVESLMLLDWSEPDTCEDFYYISDGWSCQLIYRRVLTVKTVTHKFPAEVETPILRGVTNFLTLAHPGKKMKGEFLCQLPKTPDFIKVGTVLLLCRQDLDPDEKDDPCPDEKSDEFYMSEDGRHTHGQVWLAKEIKRWSLLSSGFANKPNRIIFKADQLCTYVAVQLNIGEDKWDTEDESDEDSDDDGEAKEGDEGDQGNDEEGSSKKKKKKKKKKNADGDDEKNDQGEDGNQNASTVSRKTNQGKDGNQNASTVSRDGNQKMKESIQDEFSPEETVFRGITPIEEEFALGLDKKESENDAVESSSSEHLGLMAAKRNMSIRPTGRSDEEQDFNFGPPKTEEEFEEDQMHTILTQVALMWRIRNHREAKIMAFTRHRNDYHFDLVLELIQESDLKVRAECRHSEGLKMVACSQPFCTLIERQFQFQFEGHMIVESPENSEDFRFFFYAIVVNELHFIVKRVLPDEPAGKKMKKRDDPTHESNEVDCLLDVTAFPKDSNSEGMHILTMPIPLTGHNLWLEEHINLRSRDRILLDAMMNKLIDEPVFYNDWWKIWILLHFEEKQVDSEKVKQDWPAISSLMLNRWFDENIDSNDRGISRLIYILDSLKLDLAVSKIFTEIKKYKLDLQSEIKQPRQLNLLFHWVMNVKMTLASFRRRAPEPPALWPLSDQFLLYLNELLDPDIFADMGQYLEVEDNVINSINGEENITDPKFKTFKVLIKSRQKKDEVVGFTLLLIEMVVALKQAEACEFVMRETRRWMASIVDEQPELCRKLENILQNVKVQ